MSASRERCRGEGAMYVVNLPLRSSSGDSGERSCFSLLDECDLALGGLFCDARGISEPGVPLSDRDRELDGVLRCPGGSSVGVSEYVSDGGLSFPGGTAALRSTALGGKEGRDLSSSMLLLWCCWRCLWRFDPFVVLWFFFRRRCINDSWHSMQKMPCDVRAYLRFSILFLQFRHLKHVAQKAWSPVRMAKSSILLPHTLQL